MSVEFLSTQNSPAGTKESKGIGKWTFSPFEIEGKIIESNIPHTIHTLSKANPLWASKDKKSITALLSQPCQSVLETQAAYF